MKFLLAGFRQEKNVRHYAFQGIGDGQPTRTQYNVAVDLMLIHKLRIPFQELPLLCCLLLSTRLANDQLGSAVRDLVFSENDMLICAEQLALERASGVTDRKSKPSPLPARKASAAPMLIDSGNGRSGIGLASRAGLPLI